MKKIILTLLLSFALLFSIACFETENSLGSLDEFFNNEANSLSYQALSSIKLLELDDNTATKRRLPNKENTETNQETEVIDKEVTEKETIEKYLQMMEELLNENHGFTTETKTSDKDGYTNLVVIKTSDFYNEEIVYSLYYNEETVSKEIDEDEIETVKTIKGIAISGEKEFTLEGKITEEKEGNEVETKTVYKIIEDNNNYVIVSEEKEDENNETEHEYKYVVVKNGKKINEFKFEIEKEKNELSIKLTEVSADAKKSYKFNCEELNNTKFIKIEVKDGIETKKIKVRLVYDTANDTYTYDYKYVK